MRLTRLTFVGLLSLFVLISCSSESDEPTPEPDVIAPEIDFSITGASDSSSSGTPVVSNQIVVEIDAEDAGGIAKVEAYINNEKVGEDTTAPYQITIDISNYNSKDNSTRKFTDYTLKVTVTDTSGNESSKEEIIHIDNELPSISEVSLADGQVIGGDTNPLTFNVNDNEGVSTVKIYLNDELSLETFDKQYEFNLNTLELVDGENTIRIEATDLAENKVSHEAVFIVDNTGPSITLESIEDGKIIDELSIFGATLTDEHSEISSFEVKIGGEQIQFFENLASVDFEFDPELYAAGNALFSFVATDFLGNQTIMEVNAKIQRRLLVINFPAGYYQQTGGIHIFLSKSDGNIIQTKQLTQDISSMIFRSGGEWDKSEQYMVTFAINNPNGPNNFYTIADLTRENLQEMNLSSLQFLNPELQTNYTLSGFPQTTTVRGVGLGHSCVTTSGVQSVSVGETLWDKNAGTDKVYFYAYDEFTKEYSYQILNKPLPVEYDLNQSDFTNLDVTLNSIEFTNSAQPIFLRLHGFENSTALEKNSYHQIFFADIGGGIGALKYSLLDIFHEYRSRVSLNNYVIEHLGTPRESYTIPDWTLNYVFSQNQLSLSQTGLSHNVGKLMLKNQNNNSVQYTWTIVFDSQNTSHIKIPKLPEELQGLPIYNFAQNNEYEFRQVEICGYKGMDDYEEYLSKVVKPNQRYYKTYEESQSLYQVINNNRALYLNYDFIYDAN